MTAPPIEFHRAIGLGRSRSRIAHGRSISRVGVVWLTASFGVSVLAIVSRSQVSIAADKPSPAVTASQDTSHAPARLRSPIALALADQGKLLLAANQRSGTVSIVDLSAQRVVGESSIGKELSDLVSLPGLASASGHVDRFLCTDSETHELYLLARHGDDVTIVDRLRVSSYPVSVRLDKTAGRCFVASLWSRRLTAVDLVADAQGGVRLKLGTVLPLPFPPRLQALAPDGRTLIVAGAFGGQLAVVDLAKFGLRIVKTVPGQNIRGMAWSSDGRQLLLAQQTLNRLGYTSQEDLHWGSVVSNVVRSLERAAIEDPQADILTGSRAFELGQVGNGAGDPAALSIAQDGTLSVALSGVGEVASGHVDAARFRRFKVGLRPTALVASEDGTRLYVADTFGDSIALIPQRKAAAGAADAVAHVSLGPQPVLTAAERGERLFCDARLSLESWMSCQSCHADGHSSDALSDTLGDGSFGAAKRIPPLGGVGETGPWAWNGSMADLGQQIRKSMQTTLRAKSIPDEQVADLAAYLKTLKPAPAMDDSPASPASVAIERGRAVFTQHKCNRCHVPPTFTSPHVYDVGLQDELGNRRFNPPSLRGVSQRAAFFHDGRATSLVDVFRVHHHPSNLQFAQAELTDLIAYLQTI